MSSQAPLWISEAEVVSLMGIGEAIRALEKGLLVEAAGKARNMVKTHLTWDNGATLHAIGAAFPEAGFVGTKTWAHTPGGATSLLILFDSKTGALKAVFEAFALGQMRTASAAGVATRWLAAEGADEFAIIGTGRQALAQVAAVLAVRPVKRLRVFGRNEERRAQFVSTVEKAFCVEVAPCRSIAKAVEGASIITLVTRATEPILFAEMVAAGCHINAMGAIVPAQAELGANVFARATEIVVDSREQAQKLSRELIEFLGSDTGHWSQVRSLAEVVASRRTRSEGADLTVFKSLGMGIADLSLAIELYQRAVESGSGRRFEHPQRASLALQAVGKNRRSQEVVDGIPGV